MSRKQGRVHTPGRPRREDHHATHICRARVQRGAAHHRDHRSVADAGRPRLGDREDPCEAQQRSQLYPLAQTLMDSIGPRLMGSIEQRRANEWLLGVYRRWGISVREHRYGTWNEWRREIAHVDLIAPRQRPLEGVLSTWSAGTRGTIEAAAVVQPDVQNAAEFEAWLPRVRGKFVLLNFAWPSCRPDESW